MLLPSSSLQIDRPLRVMFLSADTGGGHRASAEALGKQVRARYAELQRGMPKLL